MTPFLPHIAFFVVVRFFLASSLAVDLAFAFALISILALSFALSLLLLLLLPVLLPLLLFFALVFPCAGAYIFDVHRNYFSVRVKVGLYDCSQLVVISLKLLRVHQQMVSHFLWAFSQHHADLHVIVQLRRDFRRCPSDVPTTSTFPQTLPDYHSFPAQAQLAASRISGPRFSARSRPPCLYSLHQSQASSRGHCRQQGVQCLAQRSDGHR